MSLVFYAIMLLFSSSLIQAMISKSRFTINTTESTRYVYEDPPKQHLFSSGFMTAFKLDLEGNTNSNYDIMFNLYQVTATTDPVTKNFI